MLNGLRSSVFKGPNFFFQIRKMVGIILSVGSGKISLDKVKFMLENPSLENKYMDEFSELSTSF